MQYADDADNISTNHNSRDDELKVVDTELHTTMSFNMQHRETPKSTCEHRE